MCSEFGHGKLPKVIHGRLRAVSFCSDESVAQAQKWSGERVGLRLLAGRIASYLYLTD